MTKSHQSNQPSVLNPRSSLKSSVLSPQSSISPSRWLITGGCGFIGLNLVKNLIEEGGHYIRIVDNLSVGTREDLMEVCKFTELDPSSLSHKSSVLSPDGSHSSSVELVVADILDAELALEIS